MQRRRSRICVLVSGGLDSALLLHQLQVSSAALLPLYVRCGLSWEAAEVYWLKRLLRAMRAPTLLPLRMIDLPLRSLYGTHWSLTGRGIPGAKSQDRAVYLPGRNVLLLSAAAMVCAPRRIGAIALGVLKGNPFGDATPRFFTRLAGALTDALDQPIQILAPLRAMHKPALIRAAGDVPLNLTFSCIRPVGRHHCGRCNKCAERRRAFGAAGIPDPTRYA